MSERASRFPIGAQVRLADLDIDPYPILSKLRADEPVSWVPETGMWFVTRRADVVAVLRDARRFTTEAERSTIRDIFGAHMMTTDGEVALRYKRACLHAFRADTLLQAHGPWVASRARHLVDGADADVELMRDVATPLAVSSALRVLGLPDDLAVKLTGWYDDFAAALANFAGDPDIRAAGKSAARAFDAAVRPLLRRGGVDHGLLADLVGARGADRLDDDEIIANALIVLFGGIETTASQIGNTVWALLRTDRWSWFCQDRRRAAAVIEEALRWQPAVQSITRHTTESVELHGVAIPSGSVVQSMIGAANRDPEHFRRPDTFDPERDDAGDHLSFGTGRHLCLGAHLARMEIVAVLHALAELRSENMRFADPVEPPLRGYEFRRPSTLTLH
jgi:cytochrome P450